MLTHWFDEVHTFSWFVQLTDAVNEARDNLKYLRALEASWEPMYQQTNLAAVHNCLPAVLSNIYTMHTISRYTHLRIGRNVHSARTDGCAGPVL